MPTEEYTRNEFLRALLNQQRQTLRSGGALLNPAIPQSDIGGLAALDTNMQGISNPQVMKEPEDDQNWFEKAWNNIWGFTDELAAKFGAGFVSGWEGILDLGAMGIAALGDSTGWYSGDPFNEWAKQDIATAAAEWTKTYANLNLWKIVRGFTSGNYFNTEYWESMGESAKDLFGSAFFMSNELADFRSEYSDKWYEFNDESLQQMGGFGNFLGGAAYTVGMMMPAIMTAGSAGAAAEASAAAKAAATGAEIARGVSGMAAAAGQGAATAASLATLGLGAAGKSAEQAANEGASSDKALGFGIVSGAAEVLSEMAVGPLLAKIGAGTGKIMGVIGGKAGKEVVETSSKAFVKELVKTAFEEGMEEVSTALVEPLLKEIYQGSSALDEYKDPAKFLFGIGGDFSESVAGQFVSGAAIGGLMGGAGSYQQVKATREYFGKDGVKVAQYYEESAVAMNNMLQYNEGSYNYKKWQEKYFTAVGKMIDYWNTAKNTMSDAQIHNLQEYMLDPADFISKKSGKAQSVENLTNKINSLSDTKVINETATRKIFGDILEVAGQGNWKLVFGEVKGGNNAVINKNTRTITLNSKLSNKYGALIGHELVSHVVIESLGMEQVSKLYDQIVKDEWYESKEGKAVQKAYADVNEATYKKEIVANYIEDMAQYRDPLLQENELKKANERGNIGQLQYVRSLFEKKGVLRKFLDLFNKYKVGKTSIADSIKNTVQLAVDASSETTFQKLLKDLSKGVKWGSLSDSERAAFTKYRNVFEMFSKNTEVQKAETTDAEQYSKNRSVFAYEGNKANDTYDKVIQKRMVSAKELTKRGGRYIEPFAGSLASVLNYVSDGNGTGAGFEGKVVAGELNPYTHALLKALQENTPTWITKYIDKTIREYDLRTEKGFNKLLAQYNNTMPNQRFTKEMALNLWILQRFSNSSTILHFDPETNNFAGTFNAKKAESAFTAKKELMKRLTYFFNNTRNVELQNKDAIDTIKDAQKGDFMYLDPPYWNTSAEYNKMWTETDELGLMKALEHATERGVQWQMSNMLEVAGEQNKDLIKWIEKNGYQWEVVETSYKLQKEGKNVEILIRNYNENGEIIGYGNPEKTNIKQRFNYQFRAKFGERYLKEGKDLQNYFSSKWKGLTDLTDTSGISNRRRIFGEIWQGQVSIFEYKPKYNKYIESELNANEAFEEYLGGLDELQATKKAKPFEKARDGLIIKKDYWTPEMHVLNDEYKKMGGSEVVFYRKLYRAAGYFSPLDKSVNYGLDSMAYIEPLELIRHEITHYLQDNPSMWEVYRNHFESRFEALFRKYDGLYDALRNEDGHGDWYYGDAYESLKAAKDGIAADYTYRYYLSEINERELRNHLTKTTMDDFLKMTPKEQATLYNDYMIRDEVMADLRGQKHKYDNVFKKFGIAATTINKIVNQFQELLKDQFGDLYFSKSRSTTTTTTKVETFKNVETTKDIVQQTVEYIQSRLGSDFQVKLPKNFVEFAHKSFSEINAVKDIKKETDRLYNLIIDTKIERLDSDTNNFVSAGTVRSNLGAVEKRALRRAINAIIKTSPDTTARSKATRQFELALDRVSDTAREYGERIANVRIITNYRNKFRKQINTSYEITQDNITRDGLTFLYKAFAQLHGSAKGFNAKGFAENINETLNWYNEEITLDGKKYQFNELFPNLPYYQELRDRLIDIYNSLGTPVKQTLKTGDTRLVYGSLSAETLQLVKEAMQMIEVANREARAHYVNSIMPSANQTYNAIQKSHYGLSANKVAKLFRKYKRGFAPAYTVLREIFGGNSAVAKVLTDNIQQAQNERELYIGAYSDAINKKLKELGLKNKLDKKISINNNSLTMDQAMYLYISLNVEANKTAMNDSGVQYYDNDGHIRTLADKGKADMLKSQVESALPDTYKELANWILETINGSVKAEYMDWFEERFGKYNHRNEIGKIGDNTYWMIARNKGMFQNLEKAVKTPAAIFSHAQSRTGGNAHVLVGGALSSFITYVDQLSRELYIKPAYREAVSLLNTKTSTGDTIYDLLRSRVDVQDLSYLDRTTKDILGELKNTKDILTGLMSRFSVAKLSLNIGTMLKQFASIWTSNIPMTKSAKALIARMFNAQNVRQEYRELIDEIGGLKYRESNTGVITSNLDTETFTKITQTIAKVGMIGISKVDLFTVGTGVYSLMMIAQDQYGYAIGTQENKDFVKQYWTEFELSQIGNSALSRNALGRGDYGSVVKALFGFMQGANRAALGSQLNKWALYMRNRNVNLADLQTRESNSNKALNDFIESHKVDGEFSEANLNEEDTAEYIKLKTEELDSTLAMEDYRKYEIAGGKTIPVNMVAGLAAQAIFITLINALMRHLKGKDDWDEWDIAELGTNFLLAFGVDWMPLLNSISSMIQGYDVSVPTVDLLNQFVALLNSAKGGDMKTFIRQVAVLLGDMVGLPVDTLYSYIYGTIKAFNPEMAWEMRSVLYNTSASSATNTMKKYAEKGDASKTASMINIVVGKYKVGTISDNVSDELADLYVNGYNALPKGAMETYTNAKGEEVKLSSAQINQFKEIYGESDKIIKDLLNITEYRSMTQEERAKIIKKIYDVYYDYAKTSLTGESGSKLSNLLAYTNGNFNIASYVMYLAKIKSITDSKTKTRKELVVDYINKLRLTKQEKLLIMHLAGYGLNEQSKNTLSMYLRGKGMAMANVNAFLG